MGNEANVVTYKKKGGFWKTLAVLAALAAAGYVAYKVYKKYFCKKTAELPEEEIVVELPETEEVVAEETEVFEAPAEAVIDNAEEA